MTKKTKPKACKHLFTLHETRKKQTINISFPPKETIMLIIYCTKCGEISHIGQI